MCTMAYMSMYWWPIRCRPFFEFFKAKCQVRNYRIKGAKVRLNAGQADAYFLFLSESLWNFCERTPSASSCACQCAA
jgi:hypothetical protein